jgi:glycosyltransferase involved in cell wall biosynthesis
MIAQIFNSSLVSGPETLVLPNMKLVNSTFCIIWLKEVRVSEDKNTNVYEYFKKFSNVHIIHVSKRRDLKAAQLLREKLEELKITIAHAHDVKASYILHLSGESNKYKRLSTHHGVHARSTFMVLLYEQFYDRFILPKLDATLVVCSSDKPILVARGVPENKVIVHLNGVERKKVDWEERSELQKMIHERWGLTKGKDKIYGILARLALEKDHQLALKTFERARDLNFKVLCFGVGPEEKRLKKMTEDMGLSEKVLWMGYRANLGEELAGLDGLLSFSRAEGLPINIIEAAWAGTPVFARVVDGVDDLIPNQSFGTLFKKNASLVDVEKAFREFHQKENEEQARAFQRRVETSFSGRSWAARLNVINQSFLKNLTGEA